MVNTEVCAGHGGVLLLDRAMNGGGFSTKQTLMFMERCVRLKKRAVVALVVIFIISLSATTVFASSPDMNDQIQRSATGNIMFVLSIVSSIASSLTAIAAVSAPVIIATKENKRIIQLQKNELEYAKKVEAYKRVADLFGECRLEPSKEAADNMFSAMTYAALFSSSETSDSLMSLCASFFSKKRDEIDFFNLYKSTCKLMRNELNLEKEKSKRKKI